MPQVRILFHIKQLIVSLVILAQVSALLGFFFLQMFGPNFIVIWLLGMSFWFILKAWYLAWEEQFGGMKWKTF